MPTPQDWKNVDLDSYEADANLIDPLSFACFLLEIECNERDITPEALTRHFENRLAGIVEEAREIFSENLENLTKHAKKTRTKNEAI